MTDEDQHDHGTFFVPMPAFGFDAPDGAPRGFQIGGVLVTQLEFQHWLLIEKSQFTDDLIGDVLRNPPFFALVIGRRDDPQPRIAVARIVRALRLFASGMLYDPFDFATVHRSDQGINLRWPGRFGRAFYGIEPNYVLRANEIDELAAIVRALERFDATDAPAAVLLGLRMFEASYECALVDPNDRLLVLLAAFEAIAGGATARELREVAWPDETLCGFLRKLRSLRNLIAHGQRVEDAPVERVDTLVRVLLREAIVRTIDRARPSYGRGLLRSLAEDPIELSRARLASRGAS